MDSKLNHIAIDTDFIFHTLSNHNTDYVYIWNIKDNSYKISENLAEDFGIPEVGDDFYATWKSHIHPADLSRIICQFENNLNNKKITFKQEYQVLNGLGNFIWIKDKVNVYYDELQKDAYLVIGVIHHIIYDGKIDNVTGLLMHEECEEFFDLIQRTRVKNFGTLMLFGIDNFSNVNTLNNHSFGDKVLRETTHEILSLLPEQALMYRFDGDQFLILADKTPKKEMIDLYEKIKAYTHRTHQLLGNTYHFTISAGIASYPEDGFRWVELEKEVMMALKVAKEKGKNRLELFTQTMFDENVYSQSIAYHLADAVVHNFEGFKVVFQPVCDAQSLKVKGAEVLLRFITPEGNLINPNEFIPLLEQSQLINQVGLWVLEEAIKVCKKWVYYIRDFIMNVNVSYIQLRNTMFCDQIEKLLKKYDLDISHITLELTESYFITDADNIQSSMQRLEELHLQVAMDDFGTGYSSLARLSQFNVDVVKIDRMFIQQLHKSKYNHDFVDSVVRLCHNVGMKVCVEGVETREEQESVCLLDVDYIQGFYVSRPIDEDHFLHTFVLEPFANDALVVIPDIQKRHNKIISDKEVLLAMMDASPLALNFWNRDSEIIACNTSVLRLFDALDFDDFKEHFFQFSPEYQPDGETSKFKARKAIKEAFEGKRVKLYWTHCLRTEEMIPVEVTLVRIPYMNDYVVASYTRDMREEIYLQNKVEKFNNRLKAILDATPLCLNLWNRDMHNIMCNKEAVSLFGLKNEEEYRERFFDLSPQYQPDGILSQIKAQKYIKEAFERGRKQFLWTHCDLMGNEIPCEITLVRIDELDENRNDLVAGFTRDIRSQLQAEKINKIASERIQSVLDSSPQACILWNLECEVIDCNQVVLRMLDISDKKELFENFDTFNPSLQPDGRESIEKKNEKFEECLKQGQCRFEWVYQDKNGNAIPSEVTLVKVLSENEEIIVAYSRDLRELYQTLELNDRLEKLAYYDMLTGVATRARFIEQLEQSFKELNVTDHLALIIFDIDYFKGINDNYGHPAGDLVLKQIAKTVQMSLPKEALLGRFGGDEFVILTKYLMIKELQQLLNTIVKEVEALEFHDEDMLFTTTISVGASYRSSKDHEYEDMLKRADNALYEAKNRGRNQVIIK